MAKSANGSIVDEFPGDPKPVNGVTDGFDIPVSGNPDKPVESAIPEVINGFERIEPADIGSSGTGKRRGRKPGSRNRTTVLTEAQKKGNLAGLESLLYSLHSMGAGIFACPELQIAESEAKLLADAAARVAVLYDTTINPRVMAWSNLLSVVGMVYGTRIWSIRARWKDESKARPKVVSMPIKSSGGTVAGTGAGSTAGSAVTPADLYGVGYTGSISDAI
jgi:hypothetical protein